MTSDRADRLVIPAVVIHPSASFRHGLGAALDPQQFHAEEPQNLDIWLGREHSGLTDTSVPWLEGRTE